MFGSDRLLTCTFLCLSSSLCLVTMDPSQHPLVKLFPQHGSQQADFHRGAIQLQLMKTPVPHQNTTPMHCMTTTLQPLLERYSITDLPRLIGRPLPLHLCLLRESFFLKGTNLWYVSPLFTVLLVNHFI